jgi:molybdopterin/thiamine biosynthesis adenylyltransferase
MKMTTLDEDQSKKYTTSDLGCVSALVATGIQIESVNRSNPQRVVFVFDASVELNQIVEAYWNGSLSVDAKTYFETQKWLKSRIYNG